PDGRSFAALLSDPGIAWAEGVLMERHAGDPPSVFYAAQTNRYMYSEYGNGDVELYDMLADPYQLLNVAADPAYQSARAEMAALLAGLLAGEPLATPTATPPGGATPTATATIIATVTLPPITPEAFNYLPALLDSRPTL